MKASDLPIAQNNGSMSSKEHAQILLTDN